MPSLEGASGYIQVAITMNIHEERGGGEEELALYYTPTPRIHHWESDLHQR